MSIFDFAGLIMLVLFIAMAIMSGINQKKYEQTLRINNNLNRALQIARDEVLRLKKELGWSGKQLEMALKGESPNPTLDWLKNPNLDQKPQDFIDCNPDVDTTMMNKTVMLNKWNAAKLRSVDDSVSFVKLDTDGKVVPLPTPGYIDRNWGAKITPLHQSEGITDEEMWKNWDAQDNSEVPSCPHCDICSPQPDKQTIEQWYKENGPLDPRD